MAYFKTISKQAWAETWETVFATPARTVLLGAVVVGFSWFVIRQREGAEKMSAQVKDAFVYAFCPLALTFITVYAGHFFYMTPRRLWKQTQKADNGPAFNIECNSGISACSVTHSNRDYHYFRARVTSNRKDDIVGCHGVLAGIYRGNTPLRDHHSDVLPFEFSSDPDSTNKSIRRGIAYNLDILTLIIKNPHHNAVAISQKNDSLRTPTAKDGAYIFEKPDEYILKILVTGKSEEATPCTLYFHWTGDYRSSELSDTPPKKSETKTA